VNPDAPTESSGPAFEIIAKPATVGIPVVVTKLLSAS
jgi:hypothetical protein